MEVQVYDDFLPEYQFNLIQKSCLDSPVPWYWNEGVSSSHDGNYQFTHMVYRESLGGENSYLFPHFNPVLEKLKARRIVRIKMNLNQKTFFHRRTGWHIDYGPDDLRPHTKTAVLYLNTNNGWTSFKKGGRVKSKSNRIVIFDSSLEHQGVTCTDDNRRVIVNFNYDI